MDRRVLSPNCGPDQAALLRSGFTTMTIVKSRRQNPTQNYFIVSGVSYRPTDLSLLKRVSKKMLVSQTLTIFPPSLLSTLTKSLVNQWTIE